MKKLLILSASFVCLSTMNFFFLWLDRFIQLLNTSSVIIGLEFVFLNLCLTISENLFSLSLEESPNLFAFRVLSLNVSNTRNVWIKCGANNGSPRSSMTDRRRQTGRQAFFFRVIGSSSARVRAPRRWWRHRSRSHQGTAARSRTPGCIRQKPLWWSGRWAHNLWEERSRPGCQGPQRKCAGCLSTTLRKVKVSGSRNSKVIGEMKRKERKWMEKSKRSEATLTACMDDHGMNEDSNLSRSVPWATVYVHLTRKTVKGRWH